MEKDTMINFKNTRMRSLVLESKSIDREDKLFDRLEHVRERSQGMLKVKKHAALY